VNYYRLYIDTKSEEIYNLVSEILQTEPTILDNRKVNGTKPSWCLAIDEKDEYIDYINLYLDLLEPKFSDLEKIGIDRNDITIWRVYEYQQQCSLEITPQEMRRLGNNNITLCIDCFEI